MSTRVVNSMYLWMVCVLLLLFPRFALAADVFARCHVDKGKLQWGEACHITLAVYTRTWFTEGVIFPDMIEQNGVLLKRERSYTSTDIIEGKRYSVISQDYLYYPLSGGEQSIRFGKMEVSTPLVGGYEGKKQFLSFPEKTIEVLLGHERSLNMTTATRLNVEQFFAMPDTLCVGEVVERTIEYTAIGVPAAFIVIPSLRDMSGMGNALVFQEQPEYFTELKNGKVSGRAIQKVLYQLNDTGRFTLPQVRMDYYSTRNKRVEHVTLDGKEIHVLPSWYVVDSLASGALSVPVSQRSGERRTNVMRGIVHVGIAVLVVLLCFTCWRKYIRQSVCWKILSSNCFDRLYDVLYEYARRRRFNNFRELASENVKLQACYELIERQLFKEEYAGRVAWSFKFRVFYHVMCFGISFQVR